MRSTCCIFAIPSCLFYATLLNDFDENLKGPELAVVGGWPAQKRWPVRRFLGVLLVAPGLRRLPGRRRR
jgi:hypothetical protein